MKKSRLLPNLIVFVVVTSFLFSAITTASAIQHTEEILNPVNQVEIQSRGINYIPCEPFSNPLTLSMTSKSIPNGCGGGGGGTTRSYAVYGYITDEFGRAVSGVSVSISGTQTGSATTNINGYYYSALSKYNGPTTGSFTVTATKSGYTTTSGSVSVPASSSRQLDLNLLRTWLNNGDFESGSLSPWTTDTTYPSAVTSNSWHRNTGSFGLALYRYIDYNFYPSFVEQSVNYDVDEVDSISFYLRNYVSVTVYVEYVGIEQSIFTFNPIHSWSLQTIEQSELLSGRTIDKIRFITATISASGTALDDIQFNTYIPGTFVKDIADQTLLLADYLVYDDDLGNVGSNYINVFVLDDHSGFQTRYGQAGWGAHPLGGNVETPDYLWTVLGTTGTHLGLTAQTYHIWKQIGLNPLETWHARVWVFYDVFMGLDLILLQIHQTHAIPHEWGMYEDAETEFMNTMMNNIANPGYYHVGEEVPMDQYGNAPMDGGFDDYQNQLAALITPINS